MGMGLGVLSLNSKAVSLYMYMPITSDTNAYMFNYPYKDTVTEFVQQIKKTWFVQKLTCTAQYTPLFTV